MNSCGRAFLLVSTLTLFVGCASFRSDVSGNYTVSNVSSHTTQVRVIFDLYHYHQALGKDAIPKLLYRPGISDWDDIFGESLKHLTNIAAYKTFTNRASDVDEPLRRHLRDSLLSISDYAIKIEILREKSFVKHYLSMLVSAVTLTVIPMAYTWDYSVLVSVANKQHEIVGKYKRNASVTSWYQLLLIFLQPFHVEEKQNEDIYLEMLSNIFQQIDSENILK